MSKLRFRGGKSIYLMTSLGQESRAVGPQCLAFCPYSTLEERTNAHLFSLLENKCLNYKEQENVLLKQKFKL